ncbi:MAG: SRPBCC family protein [Thermoplasmata archaeon]|nr:SRPBCC family protein [Thermoplasmata archaeon]
MTKSSPPEGSELGSLRVDGERATLVFRRRLSHPPEVVWKAITDPEEISRWHLTDASIDGRVGGSVRLNRESQHFEVTGKVLTWDPPRVFEHEWSVAPGPFSPAREESIIRWELRRDGAGTFLTLSHRNLTRRFASVYIAGTHAFLDRLSAQLDGRPLPDMSRSAEVRDSYPMWTG